MNKYKPLFVFITIIVLAALLVSCGLTEELPEVELPEGLAETAESAVQSAGDAAKTAVSEVGQAGQTAAVVATEQGSSAVATLKAIGTPDLDLIKDKIAGIQPNPEGQFSLNISAETLNRVLLLRQLLTGPDDFSLIRDVEVEFINGAIVLHADVPRPLQARAEIRFEPSVVDNKLVFDEISASVGDKEAPQDVLDAAENLLNKSLGEATQYLPPGLKLQSVSIGQGVLTLEGGQAGED